MKLMTASSGGRSTLKTRPLTGTLLLCTPERRFTPEGKQRGEWAEVSFQMEQDTFKSPFTPQELDEFHTLLVKFKAAVKNTDNAQEAKK